MTAQLDQELLNAASNSDYQEVMNFTDQWANINVQDHNGITPIMFGCMRQNVDIVDALIQMGADLNIQNDNNQTVLMLAIENGNYDIMLRLLYAGVDLNIQDSNGDRAVDYYMTYFDRINNYLFTLGFNNGEIMNYYNPFDPNYNINNMIIHPIEHDINNQINSHQNITFLFNISLAKGKLYFRRVCEDIFS
jgi:ankyrin repeat protein